MREEPTKVEEPDLSGTYTARDYLKWQLNELVELIRGKILKMSPAPSSNHQIISTEFLKQMLPFFDKKPCRVFHAPFDVYLVKRGQDYKDATNIVEPDICVICDETKIKKIGCVGSPDLIIEILSPATSRKDQTVKFELYEEYGVGEYWIVSPENRSVSVYFLENSSYKTLRTVTSAEQVESKTLPGLIIDLKEIFRRVKED